VAVELAFVLDLVSGLGILLLRLLLGIILGTLLLLGSGFPLLVQP
jgi:hypothetical protein